MKSYIEYLDDNWYDNVNIPINESQFIVENGKSLDSIFYKMDTYMRSSQNNFINESYNSNFNILLNNEEQKTAVNLVCYISEKYAASLLFEAGYINEEMLTEGFFSNILTKTKDFVKDKTTQVKHGLSEIKGKLSKLYEFLKKVLKDGIKSVKELVVKFVDMMLAFGCKVDDLMQKLKVNRNKALAELTAKIKLAFKDKKAKVNVYENLANSISNNNNVITESMISEAEDAEESEGNEYDKAEKADSSKVDDKDVEGKSWGGILGKALMLVLVQVLAYTVVCVVLPAIVTLIGGPIAGAIAESLAKIIWGSGVIFHQIRAEFKLHEGGEFDKKYNTKWKKAFHYLFFFLNLAWAAWKVVGASMTMGKIINAWFEGNQQVLGTVLPSTAVQKCATKMNDIWKELSGKNAPGFDEMQKTIFNVEHGFIEQTTKTETHTEHTKTGETDPEAIRKKFETTNWHNSAEAVKTIDANKMSGEAIKKLADTDKVTTAFNGHFSPDLGDGGLHNEWSTKVYNTLTKAGYSKEEILGFMGGQGHSAHLHSMCKNAGSMVFVELPGKAVKALNAAGCTSANGAPIASLGVDSFKKITSVITTTVIHHIPALQNTFDWFGGFYELPSFAAAQKSGEWFNMRLSSGASKGKLYEVKDCKEFTFDEAKSKFAEYNGNGFSDMEKTIESNNKILQNLKADKVDESKDDEPESNAEIIDNKKKASEKTEDGKTCFVLYGNRVKKKSKKKVQESQLNELYDIILEENDEDNSEDNKEEELLPLVLFNSLLMCAIDLQAGSSKGPRKKVIPFKGMHASYQFLPKDGGFDQDQIIKWELEVLQSSFKACYNINPVPPCYKSLGKWKINKDAPDGPRQDFGGFTNEECLEIAKGSKDVEKFFGGAAKAGRATLEKTNSEKTKAHHEKTVNRIADDIKNNKKVKAVLDKYPKLKDKLVDDEGEVNMDNVETISNTVTRIENNYSKKKKGFFSKLKDKFKSIFGSSKEKDKLSDYDPKALQALSYALHSARLSRSKKKKQEANESFDGYEICQAINEYYNLKEFFEWLNSDVDIIEEDNDVNEELKPKYGLLSAYIKSNLNK